MMLKAYCWFISKLRSEKGATAVEYGIMVALIAVAIILTVLALGQQLDRLFGIVVTQLTGAGAAAP